MRHSLWAFGLCALPTAVLAVTLGDFTPRVSDLQSACQTVYNAQIQGCASSDFAPGPCSSTCVLALQALTPSVVSACNNTGVSGENIIVAYLANSGPESVCGDASAILSGSGSGSGSSSSSSASAASSEAQSTTSLTSSTPVSSTTTAPTTTSTESTSASSSSTTDITSSTTVVITPSPTDTPTSTSTTTLSSDTSSTTLSGQASSSTSQVQPAETPHGGGGSPFDSAMGYATGGAVSVKSAILPPVAFAVIAVLWL